MTASDRITTTSDPITTTSDPTTTTSDPGSSKSGTMTKSPPCHVGRSVCRCRTQARGQRRLIKSVECHEHLCGATSSGKVGSYTRLRCDCFWACSRGAFGSVHELGGGKPEGFFPANGLLEFLDRRAARPYSYSILVCACAPFLRQLIAVLHPLQV